MLFYKIIYHINAIIKTLFFKIIYRKRFFVGEHFTFRKAFNVVIDGDGKIEIGSNCFFNNYCSLNSMAKIKIGNNCIFGENVKIYDHNHRFNQKDKLIMHQGYTMNPIEIGNNCWIGSNVVILKGVKIGDNCVIGAGVIVKEDIESNTLVREDGKSEPIKFK